MAIPCPIYSTRSRLDSEISSQTALAERLAGLIVNLSPRVALAYFRGFVQTMRREWAGIDQHRMNKYLVLVRKVYAAALMRLERSKWDPDAVEEYCAVLHDDVLAMPTANDLGAGFAYFVCDIAVEEMVKAGEASGSGKRQLKGKTVVALLQPFIEGMVATKNKILLTRLYSGVFTEVARNMTERVKPFDAVDGMGLAEDLFARGTWCMDALIGAWRDESRQGKRSETHPETTICGQNSNSSGSCVSQLNLSEEQAQR